MGNVPHTINGRPSILVRMENIRDWVLNRDVWRLPYEHSKDKEEVSLARQLHSIVHYTLKNYDKLSGSQKEEYDKLRPEVSEVKKIYDELYEMINTYLIKNMREMKLWFDKNGVRTDNISSEQEKVYRRFMKINNDILFPYERASEEGKMESRVKHRDIDEADSILNEIYAQNPNLYAVNLFDIKEEIAKVNGHIDLANINGNKTNFEYLLNKIKAFLSPYLALETSEERRKYRDEHKDLVEALEAYESIFPNKTEYSKFYISHLESYLAKVRTVKEFMGQDGIEYLWKSHVDTPQMVEVRKMYKSVRDNLVAKYERLSEDERKIFLKANPQMEELLTLYYSIETRMPGTYLGKAQVVIDWKRENGNIMPKKNSRDKSEQIAYAAWVEIKTMLLEPYSRLTTDEERNQFKRSHRDFDEVEKLFKSERATVASREVVMLNKVCDWIKEHKALPSSDSPDALERKMARAFSVIREKVINPYFRAIRQKDEAAKQKHLEHFPKAKEIFDVVHEIYLEYGSTRQKNLFLKIQMTLAKQEELELAIREEEERIKEGRAKLKQKIREKSFGRGE